MIKIKLRDFLVNEINDDYKNYDIFYLTKSLDVRDVFSFANYFISDHFDENEYITKIKYVLESNKSDNDIEYFRKSLFLLVSSAFFIYLKFINKKRKNEVIKDVCNVFTSKIVKNSIMLYCYLFTDNFKKVLSIKAEELFFELDDSIRNFLQFHSFFYFCLPNKYEKNSTFTLNLSGFFYSKLNIKSVAITHPHIILLKAIKPYVKNLLNLGLIPFSYKKTIFKKFFSLNLIYNEISALLNLDDNFKSIITILRTSLSLINKDPSLWKYVERFLSAVQNVRSYSNYIITSIFITLLPLSIKYNYKTVYKIILSNDFFVNNLNSINVDILKYFEFRQVSERKFSSNIANLKELCEIFIESKLVNYMKNKQITLGKTLFHYLFIQLNPIISILPLRVINEHDLIRYITLITELSSLTKFDKLKSQIFYFLGFILCDYQPTHSNALNLLPMIKPLKKVNIPLNEFKWTHFYECLCNKPATVISNFFYFECNFSKEIFLLVYKIHYFFYEGQEKEDYSMVLDNMQYILLAIAKNIRKEFETDKVLQKCVYLLVDILRKFSRISYFMNSYNNINQLLFLQTFKNVLQSLAEVKIFRNELIKIIDRLYSNDRPAGLLVIFLEDLDLIDIFTYNFIATSLNYASYHWFSQNVFLYIKLFSDILTESEDLKYIDNNELVSVTNFHNEYRMFDFIFLLAKYLPSLSHKGHNTKLLQMMKNRFAIENIKQFLSLLKVSTTDTTLACKIKNDLSVFLKSEVFIFKYLEED